jgi:hypothetical protein
MPLSRYSKTTTYSSLISSSAQAAGKLLKKQQRPLF